MMELRFDPNQVTIGQMKAFKRICGRDWLTYPLAELASAPADDHAAFYYLVQVQNDPAFTEDQLDDVTSEQLAEVYTALAAISRPQTGSETRF